MTMQEAVDAVQDMFPDRDITVQHVYQGNLINPWHYEIYVWGKRCECGHRDDGILSAQLCATLEDAMNSIRKQVGMKLGA